MSNSEQISAKLDAIYPGDQAKPVARKPTAKPAKVKHDTLEKIAAALEAGEITPRQGSAYRAWITMRARDLPTEIITVKDTSGHIAHPAIKEVEEERAAGSTLIGTVTDYREAWGGETLDGRSTRIVVHRRWYVRPDNSKKPVLLNYSCWGLGRTRDTLPLVGERVHIQVKAQIGKKVRAASWWSLGDPVDDVIKGGTSDFVRIEEDPNQKAKWLRFKLAPDDAEAVETERGTVIKYRGSNKKKDNVDHLYGSEMMNLFGVGLIKRHRDRLAEMGINAFKIGKASFDMDGRLHSGAGTAIPGKFFWHGNQVSYDLDLVDPNTGLFKSIEDAFVFRVDMSVGGEQS